MGFEEELDAILVKGKDNAAKDILKAVEKTYGEIPYIFQFMEYDSELLITKMLHNNAILRSSSLDAKTVELISVAVSAALRCSHCLKLHIRLAGNLGVPDDQVAAAIFLAGNLVNASVLATAARDLDEERETCRSCELASEACEIDGKGED
ncbi:MAG TPA: carboxymuconolactone decarboxylase family protein [Methanothrix sp.]|jgi:AhpD family alkylhydroperoxidase|uniref:carboxymuconolactone decarboxylase family protein n=1 Tax=Methanothrix sp. TaxID=90426 RepID=UPI002C3083B8|nr:carboxymuconolactone decarboxylase family protein [Methanothrix sp.]MDI9416433.1 carboxymuconolactone decarboxylase family protein [Euryarchaeota archaeon]HON34795.1 carboxymuconolactone decarboxylase family protein [Methanothrix sp.]HRU74652.1 carboxymuconolactone decarboxylase family protein [Methanothrix sp.]